MENPKGQTASDAFLQLAIYSTTGYVCFSGPKSSTPHSNNLKGIDQTVVQVTG
jgi:hypothetical protein